jgi:hypothetical protein
VVLDPLEHQLLARQPLDEAIVLGARRPPLVAFDPLGVVLRLAVDQHRAAAGDREQKADPRPVEAEPDGVIVERLDGRPAQLPDARLHRIVGDVERIAVDHAHASPPVLQSCCKPLGTAAPNPANLLI